MVTGAEDPARRRLARQAAKRKRRKAASESSKSSLDLEPNLLLLEAKRRHVDGEDSVEDEIVGVPCVMQRPSRPTQQGQAAKHEQTARDDSQEREVIESSEIVPKPSLAPLPTMPVQHRRKPKNKYLVNVVPGSQQIFNG